MKEFKILSLSLFVLLFYSCSDSLEESCFMTGTFPSEEHISTDEVRISSSEFRRNVFNLSINTNDESNDIGVSDYVSIYFDTNQNGEKDEDDLAMFSVNPSIDTTCLSSNFSINEIFDCDMEQITNFSIQGFYSGGQAPFSFNHVWWFGEIAIPRVIKDCEVHFVIQIISNDEIFNYPSQSELTESNLFEEVYVFSTSS